MIEHFAIEAGAARLAIHVNDTPRTGLLWLPALGIPARKYAPLADALAPHGHAVAVLEWRGTGESTVRAGWRSDWGYDTLLADVHRARRLLERHTSYRWAIGGHSIGGQLATVATSIDAEAWFGCVAAYAGQAYWRTFDGLHRPGVAAAYVAAIAVSRLLGHFPGRTFGFGGREARGVMRDWALSGLRGRYAFGGIDYAAEMRKSATPTLFVHGTDDPLVPIASLDRLAAAMPRRTIERVGLARADFGDVPASHVSWLKRPAPVARAIAAWLARSAPGERATLGGGREAALV